MYNRNPRHLTGVASRREKGNVEMMGRTHALSGGVAWLGVALPLSHYHHLSPASVVLGAVVSTGASMLPDLDHPNGTIANTYGFVTRGLCKAVAKVSGGHRKATHSLMGTAVFVGLAAIATHDFWSTVALTWLCLGIGVRAFWKRRKGKKDGKLSYKDVAGLVNAAAAAVVALLMVMASRDTTTVIIATAVGYLSHLVGDSLTKQGVNWLWPHMARYRIMSLTTGKGSEQYVSWFLYAVLGTEAVVFLHG